MKIAVCSDLHLEFGDIDLKNTEGAKVLILSGDICVAKELPYSDSKYGERFRDFFARCASEFPHVVYIAGNHEHYNYDFKYTIETLKECLSKHKNIHVLDKETFALDDITFIGGTLWTDMNQGDDQTLYHIRSMMNDFRCVKNSNHMVTYKQYAPDPNDSEKDIITFAEKPSTFTPEDAIEEHNKFIEFIKQTIENNPIGKYVVVGHHAPSKVSTHPRYQDDTLMNGGYSSSLDFFIEDHPQIKMWTHGHTHETFNYMIGKTRIVCNPRGYENYEPRAENFILKFYTI